jgi:hypothetical protein
MRGPGSQISYSPYVAGNAAGVTGSGWPHVETFGKPAKRLLIQAITSGAMTLFS